MGWLILLLLLIFIYAIQGFLKENPEVVAICLAPLLLAGGVWWLLRREREQERERQRRVKEEERRRIEEVKRRLAEEEKRQRIEAEKRYFARIKTLEQLNAMSSREFERFVARLFEKMGYTINITAASADEGVDIFLERGDRRAIVQCKKYKGTVGQPIVRDFYGTMVHSRVEQGYIITTGTFSLPAKQWAKGKQIHLVDGAELIDWLRSFSLQINEKAEGAA